MLLFVFAKVWTDDRKPFRCTSTTVFIHLFQYACEYIQIWKSLSYAARGRSRVLLLGLENTNPEIKNEIQGFYLESSGKKVVAQN